MAAVKFPAHKICYAAKSGQSFVVAATGFCIQSISLANKKVVSVWPRDETDYWSDNGDDEQRPRKRRRFVSSDPADPERDSPELSDKSIEIIAEGRARQKGERRRPKVPDVVSPNITHLIATSDGKNIVAITAEDKAIRVFEISQTGRLRQLSSRSMPKKSCAITLTLDEKTILTADKFGDVYGLPLYPSPDYKSKIETPRPEKTFKPSASELTVHTKGNLDALRQQKLAKQQAPRKEGPDFEHTLLLGHVSLLTDLAIAQQELNGTMRSFVITTDRDEHIRVSRGIPQTHIIHTYCLGHTEFVSKLCLLPWAQHILVAGNGEPSLRLYDWYIGKEVGRYDISGSLINDIRGHLSIERDPNKLAVSGIWPISAVSQATTSEKSKANTLLVALEGLPLLFIFSMEGFDLHYCQTLQLSGNVLDIAYLDGLHQIAVTVDNVHKTGSYQELRPQTGDEVPEVQFFALSSMSTKVDDKQTALVLPILEATCPLEPIATQILTQYLQGNTSDSEIKPPWWQTALKALGDLLYGLENLRKRRNKTGEIEEEQDLDIDDDGLIVLD